MIAGAYECHVVSVAAKPSGSNATAQAKAPAKKAAPAKPPAPVVCTVD